MAPPMKSDEEYVESATRIARGYVEMVRRADPELGCIQVKDLKARLHQSGYRCWLDVVIGELVKEGVVKRTPGVDSLLYFVFGEAKG